jgi:hypothetical protein
MRSSVALDRANFSKPTAATFLYPSIRPNTDFSRSPESGILIVNYTFALPPDQRD